jgi:hypothetical protein
MYCTNEHRSKQNISNSKCLLHNHQPSSKYLHRLCVTLCVIAIPPFQWINYKESRVFYFVQYGTQRTMCFHLGKVYIYTPIPVTSCFLGWNLRLTFIIKCFWTLMYTIKIPLRCSTWSKRIIFQTLKTPGCIFFLLNMKTVNKKHTVQAEYSSLIWCYTVSLHKYFLLLWIVRNELLDTA